MSEVIQKTSTSLTVEGLCKSFPTRKGELSILRNVGLSLQGGDAVAIMGPSGSGKSTLLNILGGLDLPTSGTVLVNGRNPFDLSEPELARFRNETIGFVFQDHHLLPQCSVIENVLIPTLADKGVSAEKEQRARDLIERVGLTDRISHRPAELSGGERQRTAIARALINAPALLLADEPTGNLDHASAGAVGELLLSLAQDNGAILITVTHSQELADCLPKQRRLIEGRLEDV